MGDNLQDVNRLNNRDSLSYQKKLGSYGSIGVKKYQHRFKDNTYLTTWSASYSFKGSACMLISIHPLTVVDIDAKVTRISFDFELLTSKDSFIHIEEGKDKDFPVFLYGDLRKCKTREIEIHDYVSGYVTETHAYLYGSESKEGLLVLKKKRKIGKDEKPYKITIAHYYAVKSGNNKIDIGLSVIIKIEQSSKVGFDITVEGPATHSGTALHKMFEEVMITGIWKPTISPPFASIESLHSHMLQQSESEDYENTPQPKVYGRITKSGIVSIKDDMLRQIEREHNDNLRPPQVHVRTSLIDNSGSVHGNKNGSIFIKGDVHININSSLFETSQSIIKKYWKMFGTKKM